MKAVISQIDLLSMINKIQSIVPAKPSIPILSNILIEFKDNQITLSATDLMVSMRLTGSGLIEQEGAITIAARRFFQLVKEITASSIEFYSENGDFAHIKAGSSHFKISGIKKSEFPSLPDISQDVVLEIEQGVLREMLTRSSFASARDDNRQVLNGVLIQCTESTLTFVGTDGKRLAKVQTEVTVPDGKLNFYILPMKAIEEIIKLLGSSDAMCKVGLMSDKIAIEVGSTLLITKLLSGQYPDVERVIPKKADEPINIHKEEISSLLRQISLFTSATSSSVRFKLSTGELALFGLSSEFGEGLVNMAVNYNGPNFEISFNPHYFLDILRNIKDETIQLSLTTPHSPALISDSTTAQFVIMPMRLDT